jgi:molybdenum cofactor guanylyltransferase
MKKKKQTSVPFGGDADSFTAVILAGGKSSRMGRDKAFMQVSGETLLARQIRIVREAGADEVFVSGRAGTDYSMFGCPVLTDDFPDTGPLAGIERALVAARHNLILVLAVDLPAMSGMFLRVFQILAAQGKGAIPRLDGQIEPLAGFYLKKSWALAHESLCANQNSVAKFAEQCVATGHAKFIDVDLRHAPLFANWNSPADLPATA